ncbi:helix-turn-helix domain-containing protein [Kiritimatiella glycovorans]|uniref:DNA binding domain, excisionase family n=1 Tax=Kiritimatiella glycovorans TaxID=1307763 RepID=A0A0G3EE95_9BACT|nr:helix-turn-helix domain-containing protein [Kiritimatiella glycovorans]AKJ64781.1 DNA binding domain, excisionase family [Kiritimatiella glycovorans]
MTNQEAWVDADQVAAHLGVQKPSIYRWVEKEGLPAQRVGRLLRFKLSEVDEWVRRGGGESSGGDAEPGNADKMRKE